MGDVRLRGVTLDANSNAANALGNDSDAGNNIDLRKCSFTGGTSAGVSVRGSLTPSWFFLDCNLYANLVGFKHDVSNRGGFDWRGGSIHDNTSHGWQVNRTGCFMSQCPIYDNGGDGIRCDSTRAGT